MKNFEYATPTTEAEVLELLEGGEAEVLAGGTDLVGLMKKMVVSPDRVVNVMEVPSLKTIEQLDGGLVAIGATVTLDVLLSHPYLDPYPAIRQAIAGIASPALQCQGTLGGEILQRPQCWFYRGGSGLLAGGGRDVEAGDNRFHAIFANSGAAKFVSSSRIAPALIALGATARVIGPQPADEQYLPVEALFRIPRHEGERENTPAAGTIGDARAAAVGGWPGQCDLRSASRRRARLSAGQCGGGNSLRRRLHQGRQDRAGASGPSAVDQSRSSRRTHRP